MKKIVIILIALNIFGCKKSSEKLYYEDGSLQEEQFYDKNDSLDYVKTYYKSGELYWESDMYGAVRHGINKEYFKNGSLKVKSEFSFDKMMNYSKYDSLGNLIFWYKSISKDALPVFKEEFLKIKSLTETGFYIESIVPGISPHQTTPIMTSGDGKVIDGTKALWFIKPAKISLDSIVSVGLRVQLNQEDFEILGWREFDLKSYPLNEHSN